MWTRRLQALAGFFGVPSSYFSGDANEGEATDERLQLLAVMRDEGVRRLALSASGLSPASLTTILSVVQHTRRGGAHGPVAAGGTGTVRGSAPNPRQSCSLLHV